MPRRYKDALTLPPDEDINELLTKPGADGSTIAEHLGAAVALVDILAKAARTTGYLTPEPLDMTVESAMQNSGSGPWPSTAKQAQKQIEELVEDLTKRLAEMPSSSWSRTAPSPSGSASVSQLTQGVVRVLAERLAAVERTVAQVR